MYGKTITEGIEMNINKENIEDKMNDRRKQQEEIVAKYAPETVAVYQKILRAEKGHVRASDLKKKVHDIIMEEIKR